MHRDKIDEIQARLSTEPHVWIVTGAAGFIGSHLVERLLRLGQSVVGFDNFSTGRVSNLDDVREQIGECWRHFRLIEGDIADRADCQRAFTAAARIASRYSMPSPSVLHQAALGSVPRSMLDPVSTIHCNVDGFLNVLSSAKKIGARRFVYASSSSVYGDHPALPKREEALGLPLSPYAVSKVANEMLADIFAKHYQMECIGLRYFNVFGPRQAPDGPYAAVIPNWIRKLLAGETVTINGTGDVSRDFCYVDNVVQANLLAATTDSPAAINQVYNIACGHRMNLRELFDYLRAAAAVFRPGASAIIPSYGPTRAGDIHHSLASIEKAKTLLNYTPCTLAAAGFPPTVDWYAKRCATASELPPRVATAKPSHTAPTSSNI
jgi:UDP-N-acetylglucosamine 4-epimerase